ncbi:MAG: gamma-glutamyl-phosphate reductase, partial [Actinobacteria bacterium]|nr:gamma-glutamyl-phosphate reductase [Actinomycetota bacterium]
MSTLASHCRDLANRARTAATELASAPAATKAACLRAAAARIRADVDAILAANALDVAAAP